MHSISASAEQLCQIANELHDSCHYQEAVQVYWQAIAANPNYAPSYNNLAITFIQCGLFQEALTACNMALICSPDTAETHANRGIALKALGRIAEAEAAYQYSLSLNPNQAATHCSLAGVFASKGEINAARDSFQHALFLNPCLYEARLKLAMLLPSQTTGQQIEIQFMDALQKLETAISEDLPSFGTIVGVAQPFALAYHPGDHTKSLSRYGDIVCRARSAWFEKQNFPSPSIHITSRKKVRLLIISAQISNHSVWNVLLHGLLKHLDRNCFEILLYNTSLQQASEGIYAQSLVDHYVWGPRDWIFQALTDQPDVIYYPEIGMDTTTAQMATLRLAPLQIAGWGHPITSGLPTIDYYLSGDLIEPPDGAQHYREHLVRLPGTGACSILPPVIAKTPDSLKFTLPEDRSITRFLICQQAAKLDCTFDYLYPEIARRTPSSIFIFVRDNSSAWKDALENRLCRAFTTYGLQPDKHLIFIDWLPAEQFLGLLDCMDIYLDTPAFSGYTTAWQALHRGLPIVTLEGKFMRQRLAAGLLRRMGVTATIALDEHDYCTKASILAVDYQLRISVRNTLQRSAYFLDNDTTVVSAFDAFIMHHMRYQHPGITLQHKDRIYSN